MRRTESSLGAGGLLDMQRTESEIGADGLLDILYSSCQPMGDEPLLDALGEAKHEWSRNEEAVQRRDSSEHHRSAKAPRVALTEAGRGSQMTAFDGWPGLARGGFDWWGRNPHAFPQQ